MWVIEGIGLVAKGDGHEIRGPFPTAAQAYKAIDDPRGHYQGWTVRQVGKPDLEDYNYPLILAALSLRDYRA